MIAAHQPTIFGSVIIAAVSSAEDGDLRFGNGDDAAALKNREVFLEKVGISPEDVTAVRPTYDTDDFTRYRVVTGADKTPNMLDGQAAPPVDALVTEQSGHALFLSLGDCAGVILYDTKNHVLMVSHLGRHSTEIDGASKSVAYLEQQFGTRPADLKVWISPAIGKEFYPLRNLQGKGLHEAILDQLHAAGVLAEHIETSDVDTGTDMNYFSHSQFKAGRRTLDGRFAIVAQMRVQGEPAV